MQVVSSTIIVMLLMALMVWRGPYRGIHVLFALTPFGMMAAFNLPAVGGTSIMGIDLAVVTLCLMIMLHRDASDVLARILHPGGPGAALLLFLGLATLVTLFMPRLFQDMVLVYGIGREGNADGIVIRALGPSNGNLSQLLRFFLSGMAFAALAYVAFKRPEPGVFLGAIKLATIVHVSLGLLDVTTNMLNIEALLAPIRTANYALTLGQKMAGLNRMIGGFPEASSFGYYSLGLLGFWLGRWLTAAGNERDTTLFLLASLFVVLRSTSSSAYVGMGLLLAAVVGALLLNRRHLDFDRRAALILVCAIASIPVLISGSLLLYQTSEGFSSFIDRSLLNKINSDSGVERMSWNAQALRNFFDTWALGAGLGAVRASNWLVSTLATTGLAGTVVIGVFLYRLFRLTSPLLTQEQYRLVLSLKFALLGYLSRALVVKASPNLDIVFFCLAGTLAGLVLACETASRRPLVSSHGAVFDA